MMKLQIVTCSTRPQRVGPAVAAWFTERARAHGAFEVDPVDLKEVNLPLFDEPKHPRLRQYEHPHTLAWSAKVASADAFAFVMPEYNYGVSPAFLNAVTYLSSEWAYKPAAIVSYGGVSGGTRGAQMAKLTLTTVKVMPIPEAVVIPWVQKALAPDGSFPGGAPHDTAADALLGELNRWAEALATLRRAPDGHAV